MTPVPIIATAVLAHIAQHDLTHTLDTRLVRIKSLADDTAIIRRLESGATQAFAVGKQANEDEAP